MFEYTIFARLSQRGFVVELLPTMEETPDNQIVVRNAVVGDVLADRMAVQARRQLVSPLTDARKADQIGKGIKDLLGVTIRLLLAPRLGGVLHDGRQVVFRLRGERQPTA